MALWQSACPMKNLIWKNNTPVSAQFDDVYFSAHDGLAETQHVFLRGNNLPERFEWQSSSQSSRKTGFTICELGFGTGLNFLAALQLWQQQAEAGTLTFISCEKYPLGVADMNDVFAKTQENSLVINDNIDEFLRKWENLHVEARLGEGWHKLTLGSGTQQGGQLEGRKGVPKGGLHLFVGDVRDMLSSMQNSHSNSHANSAVDAWFLDGFAPAKNPQMWSTHIYSAIANLSAPAATLATYSAAGHVRRGLAQAGFNVWKEKGYGKKRNMTKGRLCASIIF